MNKAELIEALSARLGDKKTATAALDAVLTEIQQVVTKGDKVAITGFGVFEKRVRGPRVARNPRTGEAVKVKKTSVPAFRPGAGFREMVASGKVPKVAKAAATKAAPAKTAAAKTTATKAAPAKTVTAKATPAKTATATKAAATKTAPAKTTAAKAAAAKTTRAAAGVARKATTTASTPAAKTTTATARKAPAKKAR